MSHFEQIVIEDITGTTVNVTDPDGDGVGGLDIFIQDQHTEVIDLFLMQFEGTFTVSVNTVIDTYTFEATGGHGISVGDCVLFREGVAFSQFFVISMATNTITVGSPFDVIYTTSGTFDRGIINMNVDGSITPQIFSIGPIAPVAPATENKWDIVRVMFAIQDGSSMDSSMFGSIAGGVENGITLRQKNGMYKNYFNIKANGDWGLRAYDISFDDRAGGNGKYFFRTRRTFGGAAKTGVTIRLAGEDSDAFEVVINDDLTDLEEFFGVTQGHVVE